MQYQEDKETCAHENEEASPKTLTETGNQTPLMESYPETPEGDTEANKEEQKDALKKRKVAMFSTKKVKVQLDSIYSIKDPKVLNFKLTADSTAMGYGVFLKKEHLKLDLSAVQQSDVFMNSLIVQLVQVIMILCIWKYAFEDSGFVI
jgi:hypothetical protein